VTFLFTDVEGSTRLWEVFPDEMKSGLAKHDAILQANVAGHGGYVFTTAGDAFAVAFSSVPAALAAAVGAQLELIGLDVGGLPLRVRMAVHVGDADERGGDYFGPDLNRCARLLAAGHGGQILLSEAASRLVGASLDEGVALVDLGEHRLKDLSKPERIFQLVRPGLPDRFPPLRTASARRQNLPLQLSSFVGRGPELASLISSVGSHRLVTLLGPGGVGKTRLAVQAGEALVGDFRDGVWFVALDPVSDPGAVEDRIAESLGIRASGPQSMSDALAEYLATRVTLLVVDNCEHLVDAVAEIVETLLGSCPDMTVLATSRQPLGIAGEMRHEVKPLTGPPSDSQGFGDLLEWDAARLFWERAVDARPDLEPDPVTIATVAAICRSLDGIPLALELAAARLRAMSLAQLSDRLIDRFGVLTGGSRVGPGHHRTLQATVEWSHDLLSSPEQVLYRRLAAFRGGFTLEEAVEVCSDDELGEPAVVDSLASLIDQSLVNLETERYHMLETIREDAAARLDAAREADHIGEKHVAAFVGLAERAEHELVGSDQVGWITRLDISLDNIRAALSWASDHDRDESALRLAAALGAYWWRRGLYREGYEALVESLERAVDAPLGLQAKALLWSAVTAGLQWNTADAERRAAEAIALYDALGDRRGYASAVVAASRVTPRPYDEQLPLLTEALNIMRESDDGPGVVDALTALGSVARLHGDLAQAREWLAQALTLSQAIDDVHGTQFAQLLLGVVAWRQHDHEEAMRQCDSSAELARTLGDQWGLAWSLIIRGHYHRHVDQPLQAEAAYREALEISERIGQQAGVIWALHGLGGVALDIGNAEEAVRRFGLADSIARAVQFPEGSRSDSYAQDLAAAAARLPPDVYDAARRTGTATHLSAV
jgi:predicted ATPase/class 3 adenylate cyclase